MKKCMEIRVEGRRSELKVEDLLEYQERRTWVLNVDADMLELEIEREK